MLEKDIIGLAIAIVWATTSLGSVVFALIGVRRAKAVPEQAREDYLAVEGNSKYRPLAGLQVEITTAMYGIQWTFLVHQFLFLVAGVTVLALRTTTSAYEEGAVVSTVRVILIPLIFVFAQFVIVLGQVFLYRASTGMRALYYIKKDANELATPASEIEKKIDQSDEDREKKNLELTRRLDETRDVLKKDAAGVKEELGRATELLKQDAAEVKEELARATEALKQDAAQVKKELAETADKQVRDAEHVREKLDAADDLLQAEAKLLHTKMDSITNYFNIPATRGPLEEQPTDEL